MNYRNNLDWDKSPGSGNTNNSQVSLLRNLDLPLECVRSVQCPRCRARRRNARCRRWIDECGNVYTIAPEERKKDRGQNRARDADGDGDGDEYEDEDGDEEGDGDEERDGDGDSSTWWIQCPSPDGHCFAQSSSLPSEPPRARQCEAPDVQWLHPLELTLDVTAGLALLSLLGGENLEMLLPPLVLFMLYLLLTTPLAVVLGGQRPTRSQTWNQF